MKALVLNRIAPAHGGCSIQELPNPTVGAMDVLVRVRAAEPSFVDLLMTRGGYQVRPALPFVLGSDMAGDVVDVGDQVANLVPGMPVMGMHLGGAFAEYASVPASVFAPKPAALSYAQAAAFGTTYFAAFVALVRLARLLTDEWVLVLGASGGVGLACVDLAATLGARVMAVNASNAKRDVLQLDHPSAACIVANDAPREQDLELSGGEVNVVIDPVGGSTFHSALRCLTFGGRLAVVGFASGDIPEIKGNQVLLKGVSLRGVRAGEYARRFPVHAAADRPALWRLADLGRISPRVDASYPLADWHEAFGAFAARSVVGRVVLEP